MDYFHVAFESPLKLQSLFAISWKKHPFIHFSKLLLLCRDGENVPINEPEEKEIYMSLELILSWYCII